MALLMLSQTQKPAAAAMQLFILYSYDPPSHQLCTLSPSYVLSVLHWSINAVVWLT